jgi:cytosine/adenosine deaminase-related metal-dependent hydrolase
MSIGIKAKWIIAYDGNENRLIRDGVVVIEDQYIEFVGKKYNGQVDQWIKAPTHVVTAGFICTHTHASSAPKDKSFIDDTGAPSLYMSSLGENLSALGKSINQKDYHVFAKYSMAELIRSGCTTMIEIGMVDTIGAATSVNYIENIGI